MNNNENPPYGTRESRSTSNLSFNHEFFVLVTHTRKKRSPRQMRQNRPRCPSVETCSVCRTRLFIKGSFFLCVLLLLPLTYPLAGWARLDTHTPLVDKRSAPIRAEALLYFCQFSYNRKTNVTETARQGAHGKPVENSHQFTSVALGQLESGRAAFRRW